MKRKKENERNPRNNVRAVDIDRWKIYSSLGIIILISIIAYLPVLKNGFTWDDDSYIINNNLIKDLSWKSITAIFSNFNSDNYAPVTDLINAVYYKINELNPFVFHFGSLVFHLLNVVLVFWFIKLLCGRWEIAAITAVFFGNHPMQVESVAWAAGGSNLFCTTFFLGSIVAYLYYLRGNLKRYLYISLMFFILSLLSKAVAVMLPIILLLIDYYKNGRITKKSILEKFPFLLLSLGAGILSLVLKNQSGSVGDLTVIPFPDRFVFASYAFISYLFKLLFPLNLSAFYPYPMNRGGVYIPIHYYAYLICFLGLAYIVYSHRTSRKIIFGMGFFTVTVLLLLQLLPVGGAIMAERYSYIPFIGIFYLAGEGFTLLWNTKLKLAAIILLSTFTVLFSVKTYARCGVWKNDLTLWNDVIDQYKTIDVAYINRGAYFVNKKRNAEAINDFNKAIELNSRNADAYCNRGVLFMNEKRNDEAINDFNKVLELKPHYAKAYCNRGTVFMNENNNDKAINDFNKAIELKPDLAEAYNNRGNVFVSEKRNADALNGFNKAIELKSDYAEAYYNRGIVFVNEGRTAEAISNFNKAIEFNQNYANAYNNRGIIFVNQKRIPEAINDFTRAIELKPDYAEAYNNRGYIFVNEKRSDEAISDFNKAIELKPDYLSAYNNKASVCFDVKRYDEAVSVYTKVIALKSDYAPAFYKRGLAEFYSGKKAAACDDMNHAAGLGYKQALDVLSKICN